VAAEVVIADYGIGNVFSVYHALRHAGAEPVLCSDPRRIATAERLVVPGVGAFGQVMVEFRRRGWVDAVNRFRESGRPFLGICVGMQMLMEFSVEFGRHEGLGFFQGHVDKIRSHSCSGEPLRIPHVGWAELLEPQRGGGAWNTSLFARLRPGRSAFYFVHSFAANPKNPVDILAEVAYGGHRIVAAISHDNVTGVQFHPERSGLAGQKLLKRFAER
jgi:glutamine amidotransferase